TRDNSGSGSPAAPPAVPLFLGSSSASTRTVRSAKRGAPLRCARYGAPPRRPKGLKVLLVAATVSLISWYRDRDGGCPLWWTFASATSAAASFHTNLPHSDGRQRQGRESSSRTSKRWYDDRSPYPPLPG